MNDGVQGAFQELADSYSHSLAIPTEMVLHNKTFISYKVTNFIWSKHFVAFEATSTFKAEINGQNVTYIPNEESKTTSSIPIGAWPQSSASDQQSNLLQGKSHDILDISSRYKYKPQGVSETHLNIAESS